jgi:eukaryotic-like serine/threonine-protein kinase
VNDERRFTALLFGLLAALVVWLRWGLVRGVVDRRERPNQGILRSLRLGLTGAGAVLLVGLLSFVPTYALSAQPLSFGNALLYSCTLALAGGLSLGGFAALRHYMLRWLLARGGQLPLNLVPFLDYCTERILLRRVGGSYLFVHRLLLEHIAHMHDDDIKRLAGSEPAQPLT